MLSKFAQNVVDPFASKFHRQFVPDGRDAEQRVAQPVENKQDRGPDKQHVRQIEFAVGRAGQLLHEADRFVAEMADEAGEGWRQFTGHITAAGFHQCAKIFEGATFTSVKSMVIVLPVAIDLRPIAGRPEHEIRIESHETVTAAHVAAFHRLEQEIAAAFAK